MAVRCEHCGHDNNEQFLFCGMCGQRLPSVTWREIPREPKPAQPSPAQRAGASLLNLSEDPVSRASYLLEDEDEDHPSHHGRLYLALVLLLITLALLIGHRSQTVRGWISNFISHKAASPAAATPSPEAIPPDATTPASTAGAASTAPTPSAPARTPSAETKPSPPPVATAPAPAAESAAAAAPQPDASTASTNNASAPPPTNQPAAASTPAPAIATPTPVSTPAPRVSGDSLAASGEKYLYGNGVPQDCSLARKNLTMSAERQNPRAQTLLGTMYTTGHCTPRDLPTAYRWFARALHGDPNNAKVAQDLELVWKQMTPSEKQLALQK